MGDVADILGVQKKAQISEVDQLLSVNASTISSSSVAPGATKPKGMSREVYNLIGQQGIPPVSLSGKIDATQFKKKREHSTKVRYNLTTFFNSARQDKENDKGEFGQIFYHWQNSNIDPYRNDYNFAKLDNYKTEKLSFTEEEYKNFLDEEDWTMQESTHLIDLVTKYDFRWPIIYDRYRSEIPRTLEALQKRYYRLKHYISMITKLKSQLKPEQSFKDIPIEKIEQEVATIIEDKPLGFDISYEINRRKQLELVFRRTRDDEEEEARLRETLKLIDSNMRKLKVRAAAFAAQQQQINSKSTDKYSSNILSVAADLATCKKQNSQSYGPVVAELVNGLGSGGTTATSLLTALGPEATIDNNNKKKNDNLQRNLVKSNDTNPTIGVLTLPQRSNPLPGHPYLASSRLGFPTNDAPRLDQQMKDKINTLLEEMGVPARPLPTQTICDLYDNLRREILMYFGIEKCLQKKIKEYKNGGIDPDQYIPPKPPKEKIIPVKTPIMPPYLQPNLINAPTSSSTKSKEKLMAGDITKPGTTNPWMGELLPSEFWAMGLDPNVIQQKGTGSATIQRPTKRAKKGEGKGGKGRGSGKKGST